MSRIRTVKPEFSKNDKLSGISIYAHFLAQSLLCYADDEGYFNANSKLIKAECVPLRDEYGSGTVVGPDHYFDGVLPVTPISECLRELSEIGYLRLGKGLDGRTYGHILNFTKHQVINKKKESVIKNLNIDWEVRYDYGTTTVAIPEDSLPERKGKERKGNIKDMSGDKHPTDRRKRKNGEQIAYPDAFEQLWQAYPKRSGGNPKHTAWLLWQKLVNAGEDPDAIMAGVLRYRAWCEATGKIGTETVKMAKSFFGPDQAWKESWDLPKPARKTVSAEPALPMSHARMRG